MTFIDTKNPHFNPRRTILVNTHGAVSNKWAESLLDTLTLYGLTVIWIGNKESRIDGAEYYMYFNEAITCPLAYEAYRGLNNFQQILVNACAVVSTDVNVVKLCHDMGLPRAFLGVEAVTVRTLARDIAASIKKRYPIKWRESLAWVAFLALIRRVEREAYEGKPSGIKETPIPRHILDQGRAR